MALSGEHFGANHLRRMLSCAVRFFSWEVCSSFRPFWVFPMGPFDMFSHFLFSFSNGLWTNGLLFPFGWGFPHHRLHDPLLVRGPHHEIRGQGRRRDGGWGAEAWGFWGFYWRNLFFCVLCFGRQKDGTLCRLSDNCNLDDCGAIVTPYARQFSVKDSKGKTLLTGSTELKPDSKTCIQISTQVGPMGRPNEV